MTNENPRRENTAGAQVVDQIQQQQHTTPPTSLQSHDTIAAWRGATNNSMFARAPQYLPSIPELAACAAARLNLTHGRDGKWRGRCPACGYAKPTLEVAVEQDRIAVSCAACGTVDGIAAMMGVPSEVVLAPRPKPSNLAHALDAWHKAASATGTLVESYLRGRGILCAPPASIRFLSRQRNWNDGGAYPAMISLVQRVPGDDDHAAAIDSGASLIDAAVAG
jgi:hypothetical protein